MNDGNDFEHLKDKHDRLVAYADSVLNEGEELLNKYSYIPVFKGVQKMIWEKIHEAREVLNTLR